MRLHKIKLAGFKSFVDPTSIQFPSNLLGVVGPNGCGKSNIIDAVRWVMGESSAKHLRGDSMADVIFNGSSSRKPVSHASIELVFDNSDAAVGGQYAQYSEIAIKRQVSRDGQSNYYLNSTRCRRRDITDIFLGTGLGPRSYSIIEQGMISRLIEAKPEELRVYLEEAAGISKYKERRRETENRIKHTRENLNRINDLREEVDKQLNHLQRQAKTAEKYKALKQEERRIKAELLAVRLRNLENEASSKEKIIIQFETELEAARASQRSIETALEKDREAHIEATDHFNEIQGQFYSLGSDIARHEQAIRHTREMQEKQQQDLEQANRAWQELHQDIELDHRQIHRLTESLEQEQPALERAREADAVSQQRLNEVDQMMQDWQQEWDEFGIRAAIPSETIQVERTRIDHLERQIIQLEQRQQRLADDQQDTQTQTLEQEIQAQQQNEQALAEQQASVQEALTQINERMESLRTESQQVSHSMDDIREQLQARKGEFISLSALQEVALGKSEHESNAWLEQQHLANQARLAEQIHVQEGWERAVETVLGPYLEAVCTTNLDDIAQLGDALPQADVILFGANDTGTPQAFSDTDAAWLKDKVQAPWSLDSLLGGIYCCENIADALARKVHLENHESVITRDGLWIGKDWLRIARGGQDQGSVLEREHEIVRLSEQMQALESTYEQQSTTASALRDQLHEVELERETTQAQANETHRDLAEIRAQVNAKSSRLEQLKTRQQRISSELEEIIDQQENSAVELKDARTRLNDAIESMERFSIERDELTAKRDQLRGQLAEVREQAQADQDTSHKIALQIETMRSQLESTRQNLERMEKQVKELSQKRQSLEESIAANRQPLVTMEQELEALLQERVTVESSLADARKQLEEIDAALREHEQQRSAAEQAVESVRTRLESARLGWQAFDVRRKTLEEQLSETGFTKTELLETIAPEAQEAEWVEKVEKMAARIQRLGSINLAAIDEFAEQEERKKYLDSQFADVTEALETLENAIRKIDKETRARFKDTYDRVNAGLKDKFPRVFGGGSAYLELTGEDLLDTGVTVMARPPGKRNSSIHLLSGGEKALTAVALVFSIFDLNPAPFCMLDEVDAPLDDANVGRFCELVKEMSDRVQFIFITHNKVTMSMAEQLAGVTMHEPGVSRMVAVDVDEAVRLAAV